jgi:hypothetical protein
MADSKDQILLYMNALKKSGEYPPEYLELVESLLNPRKFRFEELSFFKNGSRGYFDPNTGEIALPSINTDQPTAVDRSELLHEFTHALRQDPFADPEKYDYLSYMRRMLEEEWVAISSQNYGCAKSLTFWGVKDEQMAGLTVCFSHTPPKHREILMEAAIYTIVTQNIYHGELKSWRQDYTKDYNTANNTNYKPPENGFEPPMLPPTLARLVRDTLENIKKEHPGMSGVTIAQTWMTLMNLRPQSLELAAAQTTWPTYQSEVLAVMPTNSNSLG